jgi:hypothetical protein
MDSAVAASRSDVCIIGFDFRHCGLLSSAVRQVRVYSRCLFQISDLIAPGPRMTTFMPNRRSSRGKLWAGHNHLGLARKVAPAPVIGIDIEG